MARKTKQQMQRIHWPSAPLVDGKVPLTLEITSEEIVFGKANPNACPIALAGQKKHDYFAVGVDVVHVGRIRNGKPVRERYRSGSFPKRYDRALQEMAKDTSKSFKDCKIKPLTYTLRPPGKSNTLAAKQQANDRMRQGYAKIGQKPKFKRPQTLSPFKRGRLV
jgi:hypothetical protein